MEFGEENLRGKQETERQDIFIILIPPNNGLPKMAKKRLEMNTR